MIKLIFVFYAIINKKYRKVNKHLTKRLFNTCKLINFDCYTKFSVLNIDDILPIAERLPPLTWPLYDHGKFKLNSID